MRFACVWGLLAALPACQVSWQPDAAARGDKQAALSRSFAEIVQGRQTEALVPAYSDQAISFGYEMEVVSPPRYVLPVDGAFELPLGVGASLEQPEGEPVPASDVMRALEARVEADFRSLARTLGTWFTPSASALEACLADLPPSTRQALERRLRDALTQASVADRWQQSGLSTEHVTVGSWLGASTAAPWGFRDTETGRLLGRPLLMLDQAFYDALMLAEPSGFQTAQGLEFHGLPHLHPQVEAHSFALCDALRRQDAWVPTDHGIEHGMDFPGLTWESAGTVSIPEFHGKPTHASVRLNESVVSLSDSFEGQIRAPQIWVVFPEAHSRGAVQAKKGVVGVARVFQAYVVISEMASSQDLALAYTALKPFFSTLGDGELRLVEQVGSPASQSTLRGHLRLHTQPFGASRAKGTGSLGKALLYPHLGVELRSFVDTPAARLEAIAFFAARIHSGLFEPWLLEVGGVHGFLPTLSDLAGWRLSQQALVNALTESPEEAAALHLQLDELLNQLRSLYQQTETFGKVRWRGAATFFSMPLAAFFRLPVFRSADEWTAYRQATKTWIAAAINALEDDRLLTLATVTHDWAVATEFATPLRSCVLIPATGTGSCHDAAYWSRSPTLESASH